MLRSRGARQMFSLALAVGAAAVGLVSTWGLASAAADLPDGRVYEQVSPANKNGNYVASGGIVIAERYGYAAAAAGGDAAVFLGSGAMGETASSAFQPYVARRTPGVGLVDRIRGAGPAGPQLDISKAQLGCLLLLTCRVLLSRRTLSIRRKSRWGRTARQTSI